jgi:starvation-inducible DNA-binding protein
LLWKGNGTEMSRLRQSGPMAPQRRAPESIFVGDIMGTQLIRDTGTPTELATPSDLKQKEIQAVADALNPLVADAFALYVKTKNFHWHLAGPHFRDYHLLFDEQAEAILASIDILAERVRRVGKTTIRGIRHIAQLQTIQDDNDEFVSAAEMVQRLMDDNRQMAEKQREAIEICEKNRDTATTNRLQDLLDETERRIWFLYEISQSAA